MKSCLLRISHFLERKLLNFDRILQMNCIEKYQSVDDLYINRWFCCNLVFNVHFLLLFFWWLSKVMPAWVGMVPYSVMSYHVWQIYNFHLDQSNYDVHVCWLASSADFILFYCVWHLKWHLSEVISGWSAVKRKPGREYSWGSSVQGFQIYESTTLHDSIVCISNFSLMYSH